MINGDFPPIFKTKHLIYIYPWKAKAAHSILPITLLIEEIFQKIIPYSESPWSFLSPYIFRSLLSPKHYGNKLSTMKTPSCQDFKKLISSPSSKYLIKFFHHYEITSLEKPVIYSDSAWDSLSFYVFVFFLRLCIIKIIGEEWKHRNLTSSKIRCVVYPFKL